MLGTRQAPWFTSVTPTQWRAFLAAYLGWLLDGFDFAILTFLLVDIQRHFGVTSALVGLLGTAPCSSASWVASAPAPRRIAGAGRGRSWPRSWRTRLRVPGRLLHVVRRCCSRAVRSSASAWAACGPRACRSRSSTGRSGFAAWPRVSCRAATPWAASSPPRCTSSCIRSSAIADDGWRVLLWLGITPVALVDLDSFPGGGESGLARGAASARHRAPSTGALVRAALRAASCGG